MYSLAIDYTDHTRIIYSPLPLTSLTCWFYLVTLCGSVVADDVVVVIARAFVAIVVVIAFVVAVVGILVVFADVAVL